MSQAEAGVLVEWGRLWFAHMWIGADESQRDAVIVHVNAQLNGLGFSLGRGWMNYDPVIRRSSGRPTSYAELATWAARLPDRGRAAAALFLQWATGDDVGLLDLPSELQDLAIITHLAEVGRGYHSSLQTELYPLLRAIAGGTKGWGDYRDFSPSLKSAEDGSLEWTPR